MRRSHATWILGLALAALLARPCAAGSGPFTTPAWALNAAVYEANLEMIPHAPGRAFDALRERLPALKALGIGIVWLMPIYPRGREKSIHSPYCVRDYEGFYPDYGKAAQFRRLVGAAHALGLRVILDWVGNHTAWDNPLMRRHPGFYKRNARGRVEQAYTWGDVAQLDYSNPALRAWMIRAMEFWVRRFGVDGFRCDCAWAIPMDFWKEARAALDRIRPVYLLAESGDAATSAAFCGDYDWCLLSETPKATLTRIARGQAPASAVGDCLEGLGDTLPGFQPLQFTSNHDEWNNMGTPFQLFGRDARAFAVLACTLPGKPLVYNGQEIGWNRRFDGRETAWNQPPQPVLDFSDNTRAAFYRSFYGALLRLYRDDPALWEGSFLRLRSDRDDSIFAYLRVRAPGRVVVVLNLGRKEVPFSIRDAALDGSYRDLFSGSPVDLDAPYRATFAPGQYQVLVSGGGERD